MKIVRSIFGSISKNWAGHPLESFEILLNFVRDTKTQTGMRIEAYLDGREYEKGIKVSDKEFKRLNLTKNDELGNWNYPITPRATPAEEGLIAPVEPQERASGRGIQQTEVLPVNACPSLSA